MKEHENRMERAGGAFDRRKGPEGPEAPVGDHERSAFGWGGASAGQSYSLFGGGVGSGFPSAGPVLRAPHMLQRMARDGGGASPIDVEAAPAAGLDEGSGETSARLLVDDDQEPQQGQMRRSEFLAQLRESVCASAEEAFKGSKWTAEGCPWIDRWFGYYEKRSAAHVEAAMHKYVRGAAASSASGYIPLIAGRVRTGVEVWLRTGRVTQVPEESSLGLPPEEGADGKNTAVMKSALPGAASMSPDPASLRSELGEGRAIDGDIGARMGAAFGRDFSGVRIHDDSRAASLNNRLNARAFTLGNHVAFGRGEYRPGSIQGDGLIAHELAHVAQQSGGGGASPSYAALEQDAEEAGSVALGRLHGAAGGGAPLPMMNSGLSLQRCIERIEDAQLDPILYNYDIRIVLDPERERVFKGDTVKVRLHYLEVGRDGRKIPVVPRVHSYSFNYGSTYLTKQVVNSRTDNSADLELLTTGTYAIDAEVMWGDRKAFSAPTRTLTVYDIDDFKDQDEKDAAAELERQKTDKKANDALKGQKATEYDRFRAQQEFLRFSLSYGGTAKQDLEKSYIRPSLANPFEFEEPTEAAFYLIPKPSARSYRWWVTSASLDDPNSASKRKRLKSSSTNASVVIASAGIHTVVCEQFDGEGNSLGETTYRQVALPPDKMQQLEDWSGYLERSAEAFGKIAEGKEVAMTGVFVDTRTREKLPLKLFIGPTKGDEGEYTLVDLTPGAQVDSYSGDTVEKAIEDFEEDNKYPPGSIALDVPASKYTKHVSKTIRTDGTSFWESVSSGATIGSLVLYGAAGILSLTGVGLAAVPFLVYAGTALGVGAGVASIIDEMNNAEVNPLRITVDLLSIAGSILGAGALARGAKAFSTRIGRMMIWSGLSADVGAGVVMSIDAAMQIDKILDSNLPRSQKVDAVVRILSGMVLNGTLLIWGVRDQTKSLTRITNIVGKGAGKLSTEAIYALTELDDKFLLSIRGATTDELERIAALFGGNSQRASQLAQEYGDDILKQVRKGSHQTLDALEADLQQSLLKRLEKDLGGGTQLTSALQRAGGTANASKLDALLKRAGGQPSRLEDLLNLAGGDPVKFEKLYTGAMSLHYPPLPKPTVAQPSNLAAPSGAVPPHDQAYTDANLDHFLDRHTYEHFNLDDIKDDNTFWPLGTTGDDIRMRLEETIAKLRTDGTLVAPRRPVTVTLPSGYTVQIGVRGRTGPPFQIGQFFPVSGPGAILFKEAEMLAIEKVIRH